jgi:hypothetical protein
MNTSAVSGGAVAESACRLHHDASNRFPPIILFYSAVSPRRFRWRGMRFYYSNGGSLSGARLILRARLPSSRESLNCGHRFRAGGTAAVGARAFLIRERAYPRHLLGFKKDINLKPKKPI